MPPVQAPSVPPPPGGYAPPEIPAPTPGKKTFPWWVKIQGAVIILLLVVLIAVLVIHPFNAGPGVAPTATSPSLAAATSTPALVATATPLPSPTTPPATATPQGGLPCNVDVGNWTGGSADWKILNGVLITDGTDPTHAGYSSIGPTIVAPCQFDNANYAVETKIQVISSATNLDPIPCFGINVRGSPSANGQQGYVAVVGDCNGTLAGVGIAGPTSSPSASFSPGTNMHTYRVEVKDNTIKFFADGDLLVSLIDNHFLTGSQVGLFCGTVQLQVFSFQVTAL